MRDAQESDTEERGRCFEEQRRLVTSGKDHKALQHPSQTTQECRYAANVGQAYGATGLAGHQAEHVSKNGMPTHARSVNRANASR